MSFRFILRGLVFIASLVAIAYLAQRLGLTSMLDEGWVDREVRGKGLTGDLVFLAAGALATALGMPRQVIAFLGGYAFDVAAGTGLALVAATLGCVLSFYFARLLGRDLVTNRFPGRVRRLDAFLAGHTFTMAVLIRLLPVGHNLSTNLVAGVSGARALPFVSGSALGYLPQTLVFALAGSGVNLDPAFRLSLAALLFVVSGLLGVHLYRRLRRDRNLPEEPGPD
jgi:uncharacterized membrane protein YdjX (TVP38/TMEM64 family)